MTPPFALELERPEERDVPVSHLVRSDFTFSRPLNGGLTRGDGEAADSLAAPFARFAAKTRYPITDAGATITASVVTDRSTYSSGTPGQHGEPWPDDSTIQDT
jgi:hypothetical protein